MNIEAATHEMASLGIRSGITRRTAFRLAGLVASIITLTNILIFAALFVIISEQLRSHLTSHVDEMRKTMVDVEGDESDGFQELTAMVANHSPAASSEEDIYLLTDEHGNYLVGNIRALPRFEEWQTIPWSNLQLVGQWPASRESDAVIGRWTTVRGGHLFVGDGNGDIKQAQRLLLTGLIWATLISMLCALAGGYVIGLRAQKRIAGMEEALNDVARGELRKRVPRNAVADDIDHVAALINVTLDRLEGLIGNLKQVSVDIAHDLRTPVSRMRQKLETVRAAPASVSAYEDAIDSTIEDIDSVAETFDALLRISEIEAGARRTKFVDVELKSLLGNIIDAMEALAEECDHRLPPADVPAENVVVRGDHRLLNQLFVNLLENAIVHCAEAAVITVELRNEGRHAVVRVRDSGPGIPAEEREKVFRRLYRLEKSRTTRGNGLGLSLVAAIAELHGATVMLGDNAPGLTVEVRFNRASKPSSAEEPIASRQALKGRLQRPIHLDH